MVKNKTKEERKKGKILIVDDQKFMRNLLKKILEQTGYELIEAMDGFDAIDEFKKNKPDVVLLDIVMPNMDGIEALKQIMKLDKNAKVIICSSVGSHAVANDAVKIGARDFIVKPFDASKVLEAVLKNMSQVK